MRTLVQKFWPFRSRRRALEGPLSFDDFLRRIASIQRQRERQRWADAFFEQAITRPLPVIEPSARRGFDRAVFLYRGPAAKVTLHSQLPTPPEGNDFARVSGANLHYLVRELESDARMDYKLILDSGEWIHDPHNPRTVDSAFGSGSHFWMPDYAPPREIELQPDVPHGSLEEIVWESATLENARRVRVYVPAEHGWEACARYPSVYVHDGFDYGNFTGITNVADNMAAAGRIPPAILVLIPPVHREQEYGANEHFARAVATELLPQVDAQFTTLAEPRWRATLGASMGGLCAVHLAASYPELFGNCAGQSSAFFVENSLNLVPLELTTSAPRKPVRIHLDVGTYEAYYHKDLLAGNRRFAEAIRAKGYPLQYLEVHEGHSWGSWRARVAPALEFFWGKRN